MARVEWKRPRSLGDAHAIVDGDTLTLCGQMAEQSAYLVGDVDVPAMACDDCREIILQAAASLEVADHG